MNKKYYLDEESLYIKLSVEIIKELRKELIELRCQECNSKLGIGCIDNICYVLCRKNSNSHICGYDIKKDFKKEKKPYIYKVNL